MTNRDKRFYGTEDYKNKQRKAKLGKNNGRWKGGVSRTPYSRIYNAIRRSLEQKCIMCGSDEKLVAHHIDGDYKNNNMSNVVVVCRGCHNTIHKTKKLIT